MAQYGDVDVASYVPVYDTVAEFENVCRQVWINGNILFVIEEAELYLGQDMALTPYAKKIILRGRNRGIGIMPITRRIALLNKNVFSLSDHVFLFAFFAKNDVDYCRAFLGAEYAAKLRGLTDYRFIYYGQGAAKICPAVKI